MENRVMPGWMRRGAARVASRRAALAASLGGLAAAAGLACEGPDAAAKGGGKKRCSKVGGQCGGGKPCCTNRCCSGRCARQGAAWCAKQHKDMEGWCDQKYPVCCPPDIVKGGACCLAEYPVCCPPTSFEPDGYCCVEGARCVDSAARCELKSGDGATGGGQPWRSRRALRGAA